MPLDTDQHLDLPASAPVGSLHTVLQALADPVRLEMVRRLAAEGDATARCTALYDEISKSTASHHFKVLREAGLTERTYIDGVLHQRLRSAELDEALPGVVGSIVDALA